MLLVNTLDPESVEAPNYLHCSITPLPIHDVQLNTQSHHRSFRIKSFVSVCGGLLGLTVIYLTIHSFSTHDLGREEKEQEYISYRVILEQA